MADIGQKALHRFVNVTTGGQVLAYNNPSRRYLLLVNDSDAVIYLKLGTDAAEGEGIRINGGGGSYEINATNLYTGPVYGVTGGAGNNRCLVSEW